MAQPAPLPSDPDPNPTDTFFQDTYSILPSGLVALNVSRTLATVVLGGSAFSLCSTPAANVITYALRYGLGRITGTAAESLVTSAPAWNGLLFGQAAWAAWYGIAHGGARVRVTSLRYLAFAELLTAHRPRVFKPPPGASPRWLLPLGDFLRHSAKGKRPPVDLYIIDPYDTLYLSTALAQALLSYVAEGRALFVVGPDLGALDTLLQTCRENCTGRRRLAEAAATYPINMVTSPTGATFGSTTVAPAGTITVVPEILTNADSAAKTYVQYLRGVAAISTYDLNIAVNTIAIARAAYTTTSSAAALRFLGYLDVVYSLGGAIPDLLPPLPTPPPPQPIRTPSPPRPSLPPVPPPFPPPPGPPTVDVTISLTGCYADDAKVRALAYRLTADRANAPLFCARLAKLGRFSFMGLQGSNCFGDTSLARAENYGIRAVSDCATVYPGNSTQKCGLTTAALVLVSVYSVT